MPEENLQIRVSLEESEEALGKLAEMKAAVTHLDPAAEKSSVSMNRIAGALGGAGRMAQMATIGIGVLVYKLREWEREHDRILAKMGGEHAGVLTAQLGPGAVQETMAGATGYGVGGEAAVTARAEVVRKLGVGPQSDAAYREALRLGAGGHNVEEAAGAIAEAVAGGATPEQASRRYLAERTGSGSTNLGMLQALGRDVAMGPDWADADLGLAAPDDAGGGRAAAENMGPAERQALLARRREARREAVERAKATAGWGSRALASAREWYNWRDPEKGLFEAETTLGLRDEGLLGVLGEGRLNRMAGDPEISADAFQTALQAVEARRLGSAAGQREVDRIHNGQ
jgi:hypothetical protein